MGNSTSTCTHTCLNLYPCSWVWVLVGLGMGTRGLHGFRPRVPRESMRQGGDNPSRRIDLCLLMQQGGDNPPRRINSRLSTWQGGRNPPCHIGSRFLTRQGGRNPPSCQFMCVGGRMSIWGEQLGKGGRELELRCNLFKFENIPFMGMGTTAHPHPRPSRPLPPPHYRAVVFWGSCSCVPGVFLCLWTCGRVEVVGDVK